MATTQLIKLKQGKHHFELMTNVGSVSKFRKGELGLDNVLQTDTIFANHAKGDRANASDLKDAFNTEDLQECIKQILQKGEIQLTAHERKEMVEKKKREIVNYLHKYYTDPRTHTPHPVVRLEAALDEIKFRVDPDVPADKQAQEALKKLPEVIPLKRSEVEGQLVVTHKMLGSVQGVLAKYSAVRSEQYTSEGCVMEVAIVPGDYDSLIADLNKVTKGDYVFNLAGAQAAAAAATGSPAAKAAKGGKRK
eukprot:TRINITY_DN12863_c0_g1_i2.p1 TRINITY_DN12863_c0_g1~~TRINITY_DN12863_c0_g1_i2.p1  ORF type:complete len:274 (-),score=60.46 TRINITY_DN12863_c0_g1_i2:186-935(-)